MKYLVGVDDNSHYSFSLVPIEAKEFNIDHITRMLYFYADGKVVAAFSDWEYVRVDDDN